MFYREEEGQIEIETRNRRIDIYCVGYIRKMSGFEQYFGQSGNGVWVAVLSVLVCSAVAFWLLFRASFHTIASKAMVIEQESSSWVSKGKRNGKMLYILANPIGGDGNSVQIYQQVLKPLLLQHEIDHKFIKTQYHGHPKEIALGVDPAKCSCLVLISGDGMVHEVMQGYAQRCGNDPIVLRKLFESVPLALIPGGSSNGLSASFGSFDVYNACKALLNGNPQALDMTAIRFHSDGEEDSMVWDAHAFCFGAIADHDRLAETKFRSYGTVIKGLLAPAAVIIMRREYDGVFQFLEATKADFPKKKAREFYSKSSVLNDVPHRKGWKQIDGKNISIAAFNTKWAATDAQCAPHSDRDSGTVDILLIPAHQGISRFQLLNIFLGFESGNHIKHPGVKMFRAKEWELSPNLPEDASKTTLDCSGEQYPLRNASGTVHKGLAKIIGFPEELEE
jgi:sphingosine kinase